MSEISVGYSSDGRIVLIVTEDGQQLRVLLRPEHAHQLVTVLRRALGVVTTTDPVCQIVLPN